MTLQDAASVSVDHEGLVPSRIEQYGVRGLRADAVLCQQLASQLLRGHRKHLFQRATVALLDVCDKRLQPLRLLPIEAGRAYEFLQPREGGRADPSKA